MTTRSKVLFFALFSMAAGMAALFGQAQKKAAIPFPKDYRHWMHVKTMVIYSNQHPLFNRFGGLHDVYVNDTGSTSLVRGKAYPDGSILVLDLHDISTVQGAIETRGLKSIYVMKKSAKAYSETGGWGWEVFKGYEEKGSLQDMKQCFNCHAKQKRTDYVYSAYMP
jgi:hypothetical protein